MSINIEKRYRTLSDKYLQSDVHKVHIGEQVVTTKVFSITDELEQGLRELLLLAKGNGMKHLVALDIEKQYETDNKFNYSKSEQPVIVKECRLMLCCATSCLIIKLSQWNKAAICALSKFLQLQQLTFIGCGIKYCLEELRKLYGLTCRNTVDVPYLAATVRGDAILRYYTLEDLAVLVTTVFRKDEISEKCNAAALCDSSVAKSSEKCKHCKAEALLDQMSVPKFSQAEIEAATWRTGLCFYLGNKFYGGYCKDF